MHRGKRTILRPWSRSKRGKNLIRSEALQCCNLGHSIHHDPLSGYKSLFLNNSGRCWWLRRPLCHCEIRQQQVRTTIRPEKMNVWKYTRLSRKVISYSVKRSNVVLLVVAVKKYHWLDKKAMLWQYTMSSQLIVYAVMT